MSWLFDVKSFILVRKLSKIKQIYFKEMLKHVYILPYFSFTGM